MDLMGKGSRKGKENSMLGVQRHCVCKITCSRNKIELHDGSVDCEDGSHHRGHDGMGPYAEALTLNLLLVVL